MSKTIVCKGCGAEIFKGVKKCPQCGKKNKKSTGFIILGIIILVIIIARISGSIREAEEKKVKYAWPVMGIATLLPQPESVYGEISTESEDYFSIDIYNVSVSEFNAYVDVCKEEGFTVDYRGTSSSYYADDEIGNSLSVYYYDNREEMHISITAFKEELEETAVETDAIKEDVTTEENEEEVKTEEDTVSDVVETSDTEFREWVDAYEDFMNRYVDFMNKYTESDGMDLTLLADYTTFLTEYAEFMEESEAVNAENLSVEDYNYYLDAQTRILQKLSEIQ